MSSDDDNGYLSSRIIPFTITLFTSFLTVQLLYTITTQRSILLALFFMIIFIIITIKEYITRSLYPENKQHQGRHHIERYLLVVLCNLLITVCIIIMTTIIFEIFSIFIASVNFDWYDYITILSILLVFLFAFIASNYTV